MKKILFPSDFSPAANNAFKYALEFASKFEAEIMVLHTFNLPIVTDNQMFPENYMEIFNSTELAQFDYFKDKMVSIRQIADEVGFNQNKLSHILLDGDLLFNIKKVVKEAAIDFVIMGTNGATGWTAFFIGSNTGAVVTAVSVPVLSIPLEAKFDKIDTIAFTTCYRTKDVDALKIVVDFASKINANVKCLHVKSSDSKLSEKDISEFEAHFKNDNVSFFILPSDHIQQTISDFLIGEGIDMLAMLTYKRNFFVAFFDHSLTQKLSYNLATPILALHE